MLVFDLRLDSSQWLDLKGAEFKSNEFPLKLFEFGSLNGN